MSTKDLVDMVVQGLLLFLGALLGLVLGYQFREYKIYRLKKREEIAQRKEQEKTQARREERVEKKALTTQQNIAGRIRNILWTAANLNTSTRPPDVGSVVREEVDLVICVWSRHYHGTLILKVLVSPDLRVRTETCTADGPDSDFDSSDEEILKNFLLSSEKFVRSFS